MAATVPNSNILLDLSNPRAFWSEVGPPDPAEGPFVFKRRALARNAMEYARVSHWVVDSDGKTWTVHLSTAYGTVDVNNGYAHRGVHDFVPLDWELFEARQCWVPPGTLAAVAVAQLAEDPSPIAPGDEEHHNAWRSRVTKQYPVLDSEAGKTLLGEVWAKAQAARKAA